MNIKELLKIEFNITNIENDINPYYIDEIVDKYLNIYPDFNFIWYKNWANYTLQLTIYTNMEFYVYSSRNVINKKLFEFTSEDITILINKRKRIFKINKLTT